MSESTTDGQGGRWRPMTARDVPGAMAVADIVHPTFPEGEAMYQDRLALFPEGCHVLADETDGVVGYALAYPARLGAPPPLDTALGALPDGADALYLHDVALLPAFRGRKLAEQAIGQVLALAERSGLAPMLVSVYGTAPYWSRFGFTVPADQLPPGKLASYGEGAVYMIRPAAGSPEGLTLP